MREAIFRFLGLLEESWGLGWVPLWGSWGGGGELCLCVGYGPNDL